MATAAVRASRECRRSGEELLHMGTVLAQEKKIWGGGSNAKTALKKTPFAFRTDLIIVNNYQSDTESSPYPLEYVTYPIYIRGTE